MPQDYSSDGERVEGRQTAGSTALAERAVQMLRQRQPIGAVGARTFILDHLLRSITTKQEFDAGAIMDEMRGHRLSVDAFIDIYVPAAARSLGDMWTRDELDFATVTVGAMRLQALLSDASAESADLYRPLQNTQHVLIVVPEGEQHFLGAFVLAAQVRRLGCRVDLSFSELRPDLISRVLCDDYHKILFTCSRCSGLDLVSEIVEDIRGKLADAPALILGGMFAYEPDEAKNMTGVDLVTNTAKQAIAFTLSAADVSDYQDGS